MTCYENIIANIKTIRVAYRLTQKEMSDCIGVQRSLLDAWEQGRSVPQTNHLVIIKKQFGISIDDFVRRKIRLQLSYKLSE